MGQPMDIAIMTLDREGQYIHSTLASLQPDFPVSLVVGSPVREYLKPYRSNSCMHVVEADTAAWEAMREKASQHNALPNHMASWNYWRCLAQTPDRGGGLLVFEDDVRFARGWEKRLLLALETLEAEHGDNFVLALYACHGFVRESFLRGAHVATYPVSEFWGTQGMYFTRKTRREYGDYLKQYGVDSYRTPHDLLLKDYLREAGIPLFATVPSLVQHIGEKTTGLGFAHQTDGFYDAIEAASLFELACARPSDINQHLDYLYRLASTVNEVTELVSRVGETTAAFLYAQPKRLHTYYLPDRTQPQPELEEAAVEMLVSFTCLPWDRIGATLEPTDLLFLDTYHTQSRMQAELTQYADAARRYIVMHDTETFGLRGESGGQRGIWYAIAEFTRANPQWRFLQHFRHNNGLTVLERKN